MTLKQKEKKATQVAANISYQINTKGRTFGNKRGKIVCGADLCDYLGIEPETLNEWQKEGCPCLPDPRSKNKFLFDVGAVVRWRYVSDMDEVSNLVKEQTPELVNSIELLEAERRLRVARALREELELANAQQLLANIDDLMVNFAHAAGHVRATLMSWKSRLPGLLAHKNEDYISKRLDIEVEDVLKSLVDYEHEYKD